MRHPIRPPVRLRWLALGVLAALGATTLAAQDTPPDPNANPPIRLSEVITAFLVDSGVRTRGLAWTIGSELPVSWESAGPVATSDAWLNKQGVTHTRTGSFTGTIGDSAALEMTITLTGVATGVGGMSVGIVSMLVTNPDSSGFFATREMVETALTDEGLAFTPLKCRREVEGASYGNLVDVIKAPGKTGSGFWWAWNSPMQEMNLTLSILYRRADVNKVECREM